MNIMRNSIHASFMIMCMVSSRGECVESCYDSSLDCWQLAKDCFDSKIAETLNRTWQGFPCDAWPNPTDLEKSQNRSNSCRSNGKETPYCFAAALLRPTIHHCIVNCASFEYYNNKNAKNNYWEGCVDATKNCWKPNCHQYYWGNKNTTFSGTECQAWASPHPTDHRMRIGMANHSNLCRSPEQWEPWCFTASEKYRQVPCFETCIPDEPNDCYNETGNCWHYKDSCKAENMYHGTLNKTLENVPCAKWYHGAGGSNVCRASPEVPYPSCYTIEDVSVLKPCIHSCGMNNCYKEKDNCWLDEKMCNAENAYSGTLNKSIDDEQCLPRDSDSSIVCYTTPETIGPSCRTRLSLIGFKQCMKICGQNLQSGREQTQLSTAHIAVIGFGSLSALLWITAGYLMNRAAVYKRKCTSCFIYLYHLFVSFTMHTVTVKIFWVFATNLVLIYAIYFTCIQVTNFRNQQPSMVIEITLEESLQYPDLMVCLHGRMNRSVIAEEAVKKFGDLLYFWGRSSNLYLVDQSILFFLTHMQELRKPHYSNYLKNVTSNEIISIAKSLAFNCKDYLPYCAWNRGFFKVRIDCCKNAEVILTELGFCAVIEGGQQKVVGESKDIAVVIPGEILDGPSIGAPLNHGVRLGFTDPISRQIDKHILISAGFLTEIVINKITKVKKLDYAGFPCSSEPNYNKDRCELECITSSAMNKCNCTSIDSWRSGLRRFGSSEEVPICITPRDVSCFTDEVVFFSRKATAYKEIYDRCKSTCPQRCEYTKYQTTLSFSRLTNEILGYLNIDGPANKTAYITMTYERLEMTVETEKYKHNLESIFSNIGGILGAYLGYSVTTCICITTTLILDVGKLMKKIMIAIKPC